MAFALQAGPQFDGPQRAIELYERHTGKQEPGSLKSMRKPRDFAYALAWQATGRAQFDRSELLAAGRRVLAAHLQEDWLGDGQVIRGATWLKLVYALHEPALSPLQTILKAYDNMPDVKRPDFLLAVS